MPLIEWESRFNVGIESIDTQHKKIVDYINQLHDGVMNGKGTVALGPVMKGLLDYTSKHFKYEESIFAKTGYEDSVAHRDEHAELKRQVLEFQLKYKAGTGALTLDVMKFLKNWLMNHIMESDQKYASFLIEKGIK